MPELPEVENVKRGLIDLGSVGQSFSKIDFHRADLRTKFPRGPAKKLVGQTVRSIVRRAKYLLFETEDFVILSHLGMTGSWRKLEATPLRKHDHIVLHFASGMKLAFNDPRRFGVFDIVARESLLKNRWLKHLGVEPLESTEFNADYLFARTRKVTASIKAFLMDQKRVVGVGNIYASEALFCAEVKPTRAAGKITRSEAEKIVACVRTVLERAIGAGGSTIRTYRGSSGEEGAFQHQFNVYERAGERCARCGGTIRSKFIAGRNTYWCPQCQR